jgi:hypothetical protein
MMSGLLIAFEALQAAPGMQRQDKQDRRWRPSSASSCRTRWSGATRFALARWSTPGTDPHSLGRFMQGPMSNLADFARASAAAGQRDGGGGADHGW